LFDFIVQSLQSCTTPFFEKQVDVTNKSSQLATWDFIASHGSVFQIIATVLHNPWLVFLRAWSEEGGGQGDGQKDFS